VAHCAPMVETGRHPREVGLIVGNGACERFSFHGMASILVLYMGALPSEGIVIELGTTEAPSAMRSTMTSIWFLTIFLGNLVTVLVTKLVRLEGAAYFWFFAGLMLAAALVFRAIARSGRSEPGSVAVGE